MDRREALKLMGASLAAVAMAGIAPRTHAAILKDRAKNKKRLVFYFTATGNSLFVAMLERGDYRKNREVTYYASELCIAPKYLSEISKSITGNSANWWINRFTVLDISRQLRDRSLSFVDISEMFNFSSPAYFSRYVQRYLGESPSEYRG